VGRVVSPRVAAGKKSSVAAGRSAFNCGGRAALAPWRID
jgi:hypothetical protein